MFTSPAALAPPAADASETLPEAVARLAQLVKAHALSQSHGLPALAAALPDAPGFDASKSFCEFSERVVAAAVQRVYRPDGLKALLTQLGVGEVGPKVLAMVRAALHEYAPVADKAAAATPLLKRIRCVSKIRSRQRPASESGRAYRCLRSAGQHRYRESHTSRSSSEQLHKHVLIDCKIHADKVQTFVLVQGFKCAGAL